MIEQNEKMKTQIGLSDRNTVLQAWDDLKDSIFNVLFVILDNSEKEEEEESISGLILESGTDYLQMLAFPFEASVIAAWNGGDTLTNISSIFNKINVSSYLPGITFTTFLIMLYGLIFMIVLVIVDIIYVSYSFSKKKFRFTFPLVLLAQIVPLFVTVFFLPITETLLSVVQCQADAEGNRVMISFPTVVCWQGWHLFHVVITLLFTSIFVFISSVVALALFEPRMTTNKLKARQNSNAEVVFIVNKIVCQFVFSFTPFSSSYPYVVMMFVLAFWQYWCYSLQDPYYHRSASKFFKICSTYYFWTTFMLMVSEVLYPLGFDGGLIIWLGGLPFFGIIIIFESISDIDTFFSSNLKFRSGEELESHISYVLQLIQNQGQDKNSYMLLIGYIQKHKDICTESDCPLKMEGSKKKHVKGETSDIEHNCEQLIKQIERMYKFGIKKFPECTKLRMSFAFFHLERTKNKDRAFEEFRNAAQTDPSFEQQFNIYRFKKIIKENLEDKEEKSSDLIEMIRFDNHVSLAEEAMLFSAKLHKDFWTELKEETPDLQKLNIIGSQITKVSNDLNENYSQLSKINNACCEVLFSYATYLILISEDFTEGREVMANARKLYQDKLSSSKTKEINFYDDSINKIMTPILIISANPPKILNFNSVFTEITGYHKEELCDHDLNEIMPQLYLTEPDLFLNLKDCIEATHQLRRKHLPPQEQEGFISDKFGHLIPIEFLLKYEPIQAEFHIEFKQSSHSSAKIVLLADQTGLITDYTLAGFSCFGNQLNLTLERIGIQNHEDPKYRESPGCLETIYLDKSVEEKLVIVKPICYKEQSHSAQELEEEDEMVRTVEKCLGYHVQLINADKKTEEEASKKIRRGLKSRQGAGVHKISEQMMGLYAEPQLSLYTDMFDNGMSRNTIKKFTLTTKIKTMRLLNNEIKMVSEMQNEVEFQDSQNEHEEQNERSNFKFDNQAYQSKLRAAINTNLNHQEVSSLRLASYFFLLLLFLLNGLQLYISQTSFNNINSFLDEMQLRTAEFSLLSSNILATLTPASNYTALYNNFVNHSVEFTTETNVTLQLVNSVVTKNLKDAFILLNSILLEYFRSPSNYSQIENVYTNYISSIYPALVSYPAAVDTSGPSLIIGLATLLGVITLAMMSFWIYIGLKIDKKRYDIMIWFLDIPIPYVTHLSTHCDKYLKEFLPIKELTQKGLGVNSLQDQYEEYVNKKAEDDQIQEQIKTRKSLIAKNKKETLLSKLSESDLKVLWLLIYAMLYSGVIIALTFTYYSDFQFLKPQCQATESFILRDNLLYVSLKLQSLNVNIPNASLPGIISAITADHFNQQLSGVLSQFNYDILSFHLTDVAGIYNLVYFGDICTLATDYNSCSQVLGGRLTSGFHAYAAYVIETANLSTDDFLTATERYMLPGLMSVLGLQSTTITNEGISLMSMCAIVLYVSAVLSILCFLVFWLYYLRRLNTELNQTIQMLNMIPFKLLPKSRKETMVFIAWIINEANKIRHEEE